MLRRILFCILLVAIGTRATSAPPQTEPALAGSEGRRAFDDLAAHYAGGKSPDYKSALRDLRARDVARRTSPGRYLLALFQQSQADEANGRAEWESSIAWGGGASSPAREFRSELAKAFASASAVEALDAALWLVDSDQQPENHEFGARVLCRIQSPRSEEIFKRLLAQPHPSAAVAVLVVEETGKRKLQGLKGDVVRLSTHYRSTVRNAARKSAVALGNPRLPEYKPAEAFTPGLDEQMKVMNAMVRTTIPREARWVRLTPSDPQTQRRALDEPVPASGWLLTEDQTTWRVLTWFDSEESFEKVEMRLEDVRLTDTAKMLGELRKAGNQGNALSRSGGLTGQFEPDYISLPEALVAAWCYSRGDKQSAAEVLFPCIESAADDRMIVRTVRDLIGNSDHLAMLDAFSYERDYDRTLAFAQHLSKPVFDGYFYQQRAKELAEQLARRRDDFRALKLPDKQEWQELKAKLGRDEQIRFLATRLRLLNCFQWGQPGDVSYAGEQSSKPGRVRLFETPPDSVINPYAELQKLDLKIAELPTLIPFLADENFMPTFSYWRDFHPGRTLHRVHWAVAEVVNDAAHRDLARIDQFRELDAEGRQAHLEKLLAWCRENAGKTRAQLVLQTLADSTQWSELEKAADEAVELKITAAHAVLALRLADFARSADIVEICYALNAPEAAEDARMWLKSDDNNTRFWAALILLRHGGKDQTEPLEVLARIFADDEGTYLFSRAIEPLLATGTEPALKLAVGILSKLKFENGSSETGCILHRLFLARRKECLDYLVEQLASEEPHGTHGGEWNGKEVERQKVVGDWAAEVVMGWRNNGKNFENLAPDEMRCASRKQAAVWLKEQFALIQEGKPTELRVPSHVHYSRWRIDAP